MEKTTSDKIRLENGRIIKRFFVYIQFDQNLKKREKRRYVYRRRLGKGNIIIGGWPATTMEHFCIAGRDNQPMNDERQVTRPLLDDCWKKSPLHLLISS